MLAWCHARCGSESRITILGTVERVWTPGYNGAVSVTQSCWIDINGPCHLSLQLHSHHSYIHHHIHIHTHRPTLRCILTLSFFISGIYDASLHHRCDFPCQHRHRDAGPAASGLHWALLSRQLRCQRPEMSESLRTVATHRP